MTEERSGSDDESATVEEKPVAHRPDQGRDIAFEVHARNLHGELREARVESIEPPAHAFTLLSDEGPWVGGESSAPYPLSFFAASIALCMLSHISIYGKVLKVDVDDVSMRVRTRWNLSGSALRGTISGTPVRFETEVSIRSDEPPDRIRKLLRAAEDSCFVMQSLLNPVPVERRFQLNGDDLVLTEE